MVVCAEEPAKFGDLVVAIDLGTSRSAVAYTIVGYDDELVNVLKLSGASSFVHGDFKTSTSVLIDKGEVRAFGYDAERAFAEEERQSSEEWMLFKWFKMALHKPFESDPLVECFGGGAEWRLSEILRKCLEFVKADVMKQLWDSRVVQDEDACKLFWVLTVPAIWSDHARYVMRTAAHKAGLIASEQSRHLFLALEPECAAVASQADRFQSRLWDEGTRFLIADCGGGTLDITSHEVVQSSPLKLKEITQPVGGPFGSTLVDKKFLEFVRNLIGEENFERLQRQEPSEYLGLVKEWEELKVTFSFDRSRDEWAKINMVNAVMAMGLEAEFGSMVDAWNERNPDKVVRKPPTKIKLALSFDLMVSFFEDAVSSIVDEIEAAVRACSGLEYVVMAGGFAKCGLLHAKVRERFAETSVDVVIATDPDLLIVKGAAMLGARPTAAIISRKARYTSGISATTVYDSSQANHRSHEDRSFSLHGEKRLEIFKVHVRVGDDIDESDLKRNPYGPLYDEQESCKISVLITKERDVFHPGEEGVEELASADVPFDMDLPFEDRKVWVKFSFGGTEVRCVIYDATGDREIGSVPINVNFIKRDSHE
ncbi:hypothetical protein BSKO_09566 [Bryopsis sp. KO-2023]|nr:hypothetical protein BSKO_09566 [Bryopsis sp. KO-2023]